MKNILRLCLCGFLLTLALPTDGAELKEIQRRGRLIVAVKDNLRPLGFRDASGRLQGLEIEIAQRLAADLLRRKDAVVLKPVANRDRLSAVMDGQVDLAIANVTATESRFRLVNFSTPYFQSSIGILTKDPKILQLRDLANQKVAVLQGSSTIAILRYALPSVRLVGVNSYIEAQALLDAGQVKAVAAATPVLTGWVQQAPAYRLLNNQLGLRSVAIVLPKGLQYEPLRQQINQIIAQWQTEGWLQDRIRYWGLIPTLLPEKSTQFDRL